ncbi:MAG: MFS transporter [Deltaproteobacteria bacterium HGW-Deltaproteobacteria-15]|jgi:ABC-2 type transport system ATP-binding protein|nr:MAG: MFS transporter [Deltaproteobacteria bacterium HGW-Deltaproteobacteria-15]
MIAAENLGKSYGLKTAIQDVSFFIGKGEIVGLLGPNGAGKTTVLRILTCYMQPGSGIARVDGLRCSDESIQVRKRIGFLPENVPLYTEMTVESFLAFSGSVKGLKGQGLRDEIQRVILKCGLADHGRRLIKYLSKGLKQRVGLAQALINSPPILILDEPTTGLDPAQIIEVRNLIRDLGRERTVLLSTHILPEVSQICNRVIIMNQGRVVAEDSPKNLTDRFQKGLRTLVSVNGPSLEVKARLGSVPGVSRIVETDREGEFVIESEEGEAIRPAMARAIVESGWDLRELKASELSLEEVFMQLVTEEGKEING